MGRKPESRIDGLGTAVMLIAGGLCALLVPGPAHAASGSLGLHVTPVDVSSPTAVADLAAATNPNLEGQAVLSWTSPDGNAPASGQKVASYTVKLATFSADSLGSTTAWWNQAGLSPAAPPAPQPPGNAEFLSLSGLEPETTVYFAIKSVDPTGNISPIDVRAATPGAQAFALIPELRPDAPTNLAAAVWQSSAALSWNSSTAADLWYYNIHVDSTPPYDFSDQFILTQASVTTSTNAFIHAGLRPNTTYAYYVAAVDKGAPAFAGQALESLASNVVSSQTLAVPPGPPPGVSTFTNVTSARLTVNWSSGTPAGGYNPLGATLYLAQISTSAPADNPVWLSSSTYNLSASFANLSPLTTYYARAAAVNGQGFVSDFTLLGSTKTLAPLQVAVSTMSVGDQAPPSLTVSAVILAGFQGLSAAPYNLEISTDPLFALAVSSSGWIASSTHTFAGVGEGLTYYARARVQDAGGDASDYSNALSLYVPKVMKTAASDAASASVYQAQPAAMLQLDLRTNSGSTHWSSLTVLSSGTAADADVAEVAVYVNSLSPANKVSQSGARFAAGKATLVLNPSQNIGPAPNAYLVAVTPSPNAAVGRTIGVSLAGVGSLGVNNGYRSYGVFPSSSALSTIQFGPSVLTVSTFTSLAPASVTRSQMDVPLLRLDLTPAPGQIQLSSMVFQRSGGTDADLSYLSLYKDANGDRAFQPALDTLMTSGFDFFAAGASTMALTAGPAATLAAGTTATFFLVANIGNGAGIGDSFSVGLPSTAAFSLAGASNSVSPANLPAFSGLVTIAAAVADVSAVPPTPATGTWTNATAFIFNGHIGASAIDHYYTAWNKTAVYSASASDALYQGANAYSTNTAASDGAWHFHARAYASGGVAGTQQDLGPYLVDTVAPSAGGYAHFNSTGGVLGEALWNNLASGATAQILVSDSLSGLSLAAGAFSVLYSTDAGLSWRAAVSTFPAGGPYVGLSGASGTVSTQTLVVYNLPLVQSTNTQTCGGTAQPCGASNQLKFTARDLAGNTLTSGPFAVLVDTAPPAAAMLSLSAAPGAVIATATGTDGLSGVRDFNFELSTSSLFAQPVSSTGFISASSFTFAGLLDDTTYYARATARDNAFNIGAPSPALSTATVFLDALLVSPLALLNADAIQGSETPAAKVVLSAARRRTTLTQWKVGLLGSLPGSGVAAVRLYKDADGDGAFGGGDLLIGSGTVSGGVASISLSSAQTVAVASSTYFINVKLAADATVGATFGITLPAASYFTVAPPDSVSGGGLPFSTGLVTVLDGRTPSRPEILMPDGLYSSSFESIHFLWSSTVAVGAISSAAYAVGTTPGGTDVVPYTRLEAGELDFTRGGLVLENGATYYVSVKATSDSGFTSLVGTNPGQMVDGIVPGQPPLPSITVGANTLLINWGPATSGPSGLRGYLVEFRDLISPLWYNARTRALSDSNVRAFSLAGKEYTVAQSTDSVIAAPPFGASNLPRGTLIIRVRAVSGADLVGPPSEGVKVQFGGLPPGALSNFSSYPNPFNSRSGQATLVYEMAEASDVRIQIFNIFGGKVREMSFASGASGGLAGTNEVSWDGTNDSGAKVSKGIYIAVITAGGAKATYKIGVIH